MPAPINLNPAHGDDSICFCGTCEEAIDAAIRTVKNMNEYDCAVWNAQVGFGIMIVTTALMERATGKKGVFTEIADNMIKVAARPEVSKKINEYVEYEENRK